MKKVVIACSGAKHLAKTVARKAGVKAYELKTDRFPDTELRVKLPCDVKGKNIYFIQSFYKTKESDINDKLIEVLFAAHTARKLKAKKIFLLAPYLAYLREDKSFEKGEAISAKILAELFKIFNKVYVIEPHLHRFKKFSDFFPNAVKISLSDEVADYIRENIKFECVLVGPDQESEQWVEAVAKKINSKYIILKKKRFSSRKVKVKGKQISADKAIIMDDIISTGQTMIEASKLIKAKQIYFIGMHGLFSENAIEKLGKKGKVISSNSIPSKASKIDCSNVLARIIK